MSLSDSRRDAFDAVYGSSAGAINATYFLSGQREGVNIYCEDIANRRFVDLRRLVPRRGELAPSASQVLWSSGLWCWRCRQPRSPATFICPP